MLRLAKSSVGSYFVISVTSVMKFVCLDPLPGNDQHFELACHPTEEPGDEEKPFQSKVDNRGIEGASAWFRCE